MNLYLDIETIGTEDLSVIADLNAEITPPANYSKPETIDAWNNKDRVKLLADVISKTAFDGAYGQVLAVAWALDDDPVRGIIQCPQVGGFSVGEHSLLFQAFSEINGEINAKSKSYPVRPIVIGHNVVFDNRFLFQRAVVNKVIAPRWLQDALQVKPWDANDTMVLWDPDRQKRIKLDKLCKALGIESPKGAGMDGSQVWQAWRDGRAGEISEYNKSDVEAVRRAYKRLTGVWRG